MKKALAVLLTCGLVMSGVPVLAGETQSEAAQSEAAQSVAVQSEAAQSEAVQSEETKKEAVEPVYMDDFTVETIDGSTFTLSEVLKDHDLAFINLWASWCGPCQYEFPFLQEAWQENQDKVAVIALSVEPKDTVDDLRAYAEENGLTFPMGLVGDTGLDKFADQGTPTSVVVNSDGKIMAVEVGSLGSAEDFLKLFEGYTGDNYNPEECTYTVYAEDEEMNPVADVTFGFCTDTACKYVTTDEKGKAVFTGVPTKYHVQIIDVPEGFSDEMENELYTEPYDQTLFIGITKE
jgi:thiol-disulfide isomerase/thioredoxin